jgi:hypothetical protein
MTEDLPEPGAPADPFAGMSDVQVLELAAAHLRREASLPPCSLGRIIAAQQYDRCRTELDRRAFTRVLARVTRSLGQLAPRAEVW